MTLSELIKHVGDDHVTFQPLASSMINANITKRGGVISFATDRSIVMDMAMEGPQKLTGLIVWLPTERLPKAIQESAAGE